jgi:hypothetical protein
LLNITGDNASNNQTLIEAIQCKLPYLSENEIFIGCLDHILNLAVKSFLKKLKFGSYQETSEQIKKDVEIGCLSRDVHDSPIKKVYIQCIIF